MAQVVEHILGKDEVGSSSLPNSSRRKNVQFFGRFFVFKLFFSQKRSFFMPNG